MQGNPTLFEQPKLCKRCSRVLPLTAFYPSHPWACKECISVKTKARYLAKRDEIRAQMSAYGKANRPAVNEASRRYRERHKATVNRRARVKYHADLDRSRRIAAETTQRRRARMASTPSVIVRTAALDAKWTYWAGMCWICRVQPATEWDHVKPLFVGGAHMLCNLRPACQPCNRKKWTTWPFDPGARA